MTTYLFVTDIAVKQSDKPDLMIYKKADTEVWPANDGSEIPSIASEHIKAKEYCVNGTYVHIGLCRKVENLLEIPLRAHENTEREIRQLRKECERRIAETKKFQKAYERARKVLADFWELPWYARLWLVLRRDF